MIIKEGAKEIIQELKSHGFDAYVVGGCVRDTLLEKTPSDWDITTSATPEEVMRIFKDTKPTGLKHGTVTVNHDYEVTTFRVDGDYSDNRHPDKVIFSKDINQDLARRDFTINAMAHDGQTLVDPFRGLMDLHEGILRCVGDAQTRFQEDGLRIMRALRFAATYDLRIAPDTATAIHMYKGLLCSIAPERIRGELCKLLCGKSALRILLSFPDVISLIIPPLRPCIGFKQNNRYHCYDVYEHIVHAVAAYSGTDLSIKMALLLHDVGKPLVYSRDDRGGHFYGHQEVSKKLTDKVMAGLRFDNKTASDVSQLVLYHDSEFAPTKKAVRRWFNKVGPELFEKLLCIREADCLAHTPNTQTKYLSVLPEIRKIMKDILAENDCFSLKNLAINGRDILTTGIPEGKRVGEILNRLLEEVLDERLENEHETLMGRVWELIYLPPSKS